MNKSFDLSKTTGKLGEYFKGDKGRRLLLIAGAAGILLIFLSTIWPQNKSPAAQTAKNSVEEATVQYIGKMEQRLLDIVGKIDGVGSMQVMVTLENSVEYVYATQERKNTDKSEDLSGSSTTRTSERDDTEKSIIIIENAEGGKEALLRTQIEPTIKGVVIVCEGGDQVAVQKRVTEVVTTALNISSRRVCVSKLS